MAMWTVARYPNGSWDTGGKASDPEYAQCEVFRINAGHRDEALAAAKKEHRATLSKAKRLATKAEQAT